MYNYDFPKTLLENISDQNDKVNQCIDIVNGYTTDEETRVNQELQREENEKRREEQYNNNENRFATINSQLETMEKKIAVSITDYKDKKNGEDWSTVFNFIIENNISNHIIVPIGSYDIYNSINLKSVIYIEGENGEGFNREGKSCINVKGSFPAFKFYDNIIDQQNGDVTIEKLVINGGTNCIDLPLCHMLRVRKCSFMNFTQNGIVLVRGERHVFKDLVFWANNNNFDSAFAFSDKSKSSSLVIQNMEFPTDGQWVDRFEISNVVTMMGNNNSYNYSLWSNGIVSHGTIKNFYCHGGLKGVFNAKRVQQCDFSNWVIDGWGSAENPCEKLINIYENCIDTNFMSISPAFSGNNKTLTQIYIKTLTGVTFNSCYATGNNVDTFGFKFGNTQGQIITLIGCRGSIFTESTNPLIKSQINQIGCYFLNNNIGYSSFYPNGFNEIHTLMNDTNGATASTNKVVWQQSRGNGNIGNMFTIETDRIIIKHSGSAVIVGNGDPNGKYSAEKGSLFLRQDGGAGTTLYVKESGGTGNTGWVAK